MCFGFVKFKHISSCNSKYMSQFCIFELSYRWGLAPRVSNVQNAQDPLGLVDTAFFFEMTITTTSKLVPCHAVFMSFIREVYTGNPTYYTRELKSNSN